MFPLHIRIKFTMLLFVKTSHTISGKSLGKTGFFQTAIFFAAALFDLHVCPSPSLSRPVDLLKSFHSLFLKCLFSMKVCVRPYIRPSSSPSIRLCVHPYVRQVLFLREQKSTKKISWSKSRYAGRLGVKKH